MIDRTTKLLLLLIALGLLANAVALLLHPVKTLAASPFSCDGELKANAFGATAPSLGGYKASFSCQ